MAYSTTKAFGRCISSRREHTGVRCVKHLVWVYIMLWQAHCGFSMDPDEPWRTPVPVYRAWSAMYNRHFYTTDDSEMDRWLSHPSKAWEYEGIVYYAYAEPDEPGVMAVYRFYSEMLNTHFYTIAPSEKNKLIDDHSDVWMYEGIAFFAFPNDYQPGGTSPVYRFWSDRLGYHFYTISESEKNKLINNYSDVWSYEGISWYAIPLRASSSSTVYYCDPANGDTQSGDGSRGNPWGTLESVVDAGYFAGTIVDGDTLKLRTGFHGEFDTQKFHGSYRVKSDYVSIEADDGATADLSRIILKGCSHWRFRGLNISPDLARPSLVANHGANPTPGIIYGYGNDHIEVEQCDIFTVDDSSRWDVDDWTYLSWHGIDCSASSSSYRSNTIRNVRIGLKAGADCRVENNLVDGFCNDGIDFGGPNTTVQDNIVVNVYDNSGSPHWHSDGIQAWGDSDDAGWHLTVRRNYINARTNPDRDPQTLQGLQGIFLRGFSDVYDTVVENNVVLVLHSSHGLVVGYGEGATVRNTRIVNNTVVNPYGLSDGGQPNIHIANATPQNVIIRNNIADSWPEPDASRGLLVDHNFDIDDYDPQLEFVDYINGDVRLAGGSHFIDAGTTDDAPRGDIEGRTRPQGQSTDVGAYEYAY